MCGIFGSFSPYPQHIDEASLRTSMHSRGPDFFCIKHNKNGLLAHSRLSIVDLSASGNQPMTSHCGRYQIVFNGEIYNAQQLKQSLISKYQINFESSSDTEVILSGYSIHGDSFIQQLDGMFAFAIYDNLSSSLFLARDRYGIKPLLYSYSNNHLFFASDIRTILASGLVSRRLNQHALGPLFYFGSVQQPDTILSGVQCIPPGTFAKVNLYQPISFTTYYSLPSCSTSCNVSSHSAVLSNIRSLVSKSISKSLVSDEPLACFLSGGVDSAILLGYATHKLHESVTAIHLSMPKEYGYINELDSAIVTAQSFDSHFINHSYQPDRIHQYLDQFIHAIDQPSIDGFNVFLISQVAKQYTKVALTGLGSDELFCGYPLFDQIASELSSPRRIRRQLLRNLHRLRPSRFTKECRIANLTIFEAYNELRRSTPKYSYYRAYNQAFNPSNHPISQCDTSDSSYRHISILEFQGYLVNTLLRDADAASMWSSIELRPSLLDHHLVDYVLSLPDEYKSGMYFNKRLLSDAMSDYIPPHLKKPHPKKGFEIPIAHHMNNELKERYLDLAQGSLSTALHGKRIINNILHRSRNSRLGNWDWLNLVFLSWCHNYEVYP